MMVHDSTASLPLSNVRRRQEAKPPLCAVEACRAPEALYSDGAGESVEGGLQVSIHGLGWRFAELGGCVGGDTPGRLLDRGGRPGGRPSSTSTR
jgi:hypothetical protein